MSAPSVLVVDDDPAVREVVAEGLQTEGYDILFAENGAEALVLVREAHPSVIILDLGMPVMGGLEFLSEIKLKPSDPIAVVVLTASGDAESAGASFDAGVSAFVKKPFTLNELRGAVKNAIAAKEHSALVTQLALAGAVQGVIQDEISQRLDAIGKYLQDVAGLKNKLGNMVGASLDPEIRELLSLLAPPGPQAGAEPGDGEQPTELDQFRA